MYSTPLFKHKSQIVLSSSMRKVFLGPDPEKRRGLCNTRELSRIVEGTTLLAGSRLTRDSEKQTH